MAVSFFLLVSSLGLAITAQAQDCTIPVPGPNMNLKDDYILLQTFPNGSKVSFGCEVGYQSAGGSPAVTCTAGKWSPVKLQCERKNCGALDNVMNGIANYPTNTLFGDTAEIKCNEGYTRVGKDKIRCGDAGWMDRLPVCEVIKCDPPPAIADGSFYTEKESYEYLEVVQYSCQNGLSLSGSKSLTCSVNGTFTPAPPTCKNVQCEEPNIANADWITGSRPPFKHKASVTHHCRTGYVNIGASTSVCELEGQWVPKLLECKPKSCSKPVGGSNMNLKDQDVPSQTFPHATSVTFVCDEGYEDAGGSAVTTCTLGNWSPVKLTCKKKLPSPPATVKPGGKDGEDDNGDKRENGKGAENGGSSTDNTGKIIGGTVAAVAVVAIVAVGCYKRKKKGAEKVAAENETTGDGEAVQLQSCNHSDPDTLHHMKA